ncbi:MAG: capsular biosynthesis protein [Bacilli bacterium]
MIKDTNVIVFDIDGTLCYSRKEGQSYLDIEPMQDVLDKLLEYHANGFYIILQTARQMRTHEGNVGRINAVTGKELFAWLEKFDIPFDEVHFGKPWCGKNGFYVDDKAIRPNEFVNLSFDEIQELISTDSQ